MKPLADGTVGFFGGTLIDTNFVIRQVYNRGDFLARDYDLKKVRQLDYFWDLMRKAPAPQLSEPGHGNIMQPRLIAMRYPVLTDGKLVSVVSIMVRSIFMLQRRQAKAEGWLQIVQSVRLASGRTVKRGLSARQTASRKLREPPGHA